MGKGENHNKLKRSMQAKDIFKTALIMGLITIAAIIVCALIYVGLLKIGFPKAEWIVVPFGTAIGLMWLDLILKA